MRELWIGVVEVLTDATTGSGDTRAYTNVITWAESSAGFVTTVTEVFAEYGWSVMGAESVRTVASDSGYKPEIAEIIERARANPQACMYATFHYYPSRPQ